MWTMGKDNGYAFADVWYSNMDKLIQIMNEHARNDFRHLSPSFITGTGLETFDPVKLMQSVQSIVCC